MANTILQVLTSNTFDQWRIVTNSLVNAVNDLRNNTFIKDSGGLTLSNGSIVLSNGTLQISKPSGETFYVAADSRISGNLTVTGNVIVSGNIILGTSNLLDTVNRANAQANSAANTVRVTANSGSTQSAVSLNFVNTSTVTVSVGAGSTGNANVSFGVVPTFSTLTVNGDATVTGNVITKGFMTLDTAVKTSNFNAAVNKRYLANTTAGAITMTLPSTPTIGDRVAVADYARTFAVYNLTIGRNTNLIMGLSEDLTCDVAGAPVDLIYTDTTRGWILI